MLKKLKSLLLDDTVYIAILLVITAVLSFGLGKLSVTSSSSGAVSKAESPVVRALVTPTKGEQPVEPMRVTPMVSSTPGLAQTITQAVPVKNFVASKSGTKYHALTCSGAKTIKETNKIYFSSEVEAQAAGYTRSANCKFATPAP
ncbi:MAG: hypothetical protein V4606_03170 [Patescibacteria group bacterium]